MIKRIQTYSLKNHNTFGINVLADEFIEYSTTEELISLLKEEKLRATKLLSIGSGSNMLFISDFNGIVLHSKISDILLELETDKEVVVSAGAGIIWDDFVIWCINQGFGGIENLSNIPGTVGAAVIQNIGAYGVELKDIFHKVEGIFIDNCEKFCFYQTDCDFNYRYSIFKGQLKDKAIITKLFLKLNKKPKFNIEYAALKSQLEKEKDELSLKKIREVIISIRKSKLPDPEIVGNAGSFFKNPIISLQDFIKIEKNYPKIPFFETSQKNFRKIPAAWLIEKAGWKGKQLGNAGVHSQQAVVLVNLQNANGKEILKLACEIEKDIEQKFGILLEREVNVI